MSGTQRVYGITEDGFNRMRMPEIREAIIIDLKARTGYTFETRPDSITGQFINTFAEREATLWELSEAVYHAMYPVSAFGKNLDESVSFAGVVRLTERRSNGMIYCYGTEGTTIPIGSIVRHNLTLELFELVTDTTISRLAAIDATLLVTGVAVGIVYTVTVDGTAYSYTAVAGDTNVSVASQLATRLNATGLIVVTNAAEIRMLKLELIPFNFSVTANITILKIASGALYTSQNYGPIDVSANSITEIVSTRAGWDGVNNIEPGLIGRNDETDDELRRRYDHGVFRLGAGTLEAIDANLRQNIPGLLSLKVFENVNDVPDVDGRVPHCIEVVALGGSTFLIAQEIFLVKGAGIDTHGTTIIDVRDSHGYIHPIHFNRPTVIYVWVNCTITLYNEENFPLQGDVLVEEVIVETGNTFGIGTDVIIQRLHGPIYSNVKGIENLSITIAASADPLYVPAPGDFTTNTFPIGVRELSRFDASRIVVTVL